MGTGRPIVVLAGLSHTTGIPTDGFARGVAGPVRRLAERRRVIVLNRRRGIPRGFTMADFAAEHADALAELGEPVDVVGMSTGGSIAQQLAADRPEVVRRLVLLSTAHRLSEHGRALQAAVAERLRAGRTREAMAVAVADLFPPALRGLGRRVGSATAYRLITTPQAGDDLAATIEAEDSFDLSSCRGVIGAPTLIVAGGRDDFYTVPLFRETAALIPNSRLMLMARRGHVTVTHDPRARAEIAMFLSS